MLSGEEEIEWCHQIIRARIIVAHSNGIDQQSSKQLPSFFLGFVEKNEGVTFLGEGSANRHLTSGWIGEAHLRDFLNTCIVWTMRSWH